MEVGDSTGYATSGYQSSYDAKDNQPDAQSRTNAYGLSDDTNNGLEQNITIELVNVTGNSWTISHTGCLLYTSPSPRDQRGSRMPSSA